MREREREIVNREHDLAFVYINEHLEEIKFEKTKTQSSSGCSISVLNKQLHFCIYA